MHRLIVLTALIFVVALGIGSMALAADDGTAKLFNSKCATCHGKDGKAKTKMGEKLEIRDFTDPEVQKTFTDEDAESAILNGVKRDGKLVMKGKKGKLKPEEVKALVKFVRGFSK